MGGYRGFAFDGFFPVLGFLLDPTLSLIVSSDLPKALWSAFAASLIPGAEKDLHDGEMLPCIQCYIFLIVIIAPAFCQGGFLSQLFETAGLPPHK